MYLGYFIDVAFIEYFYIYI